MRCPGCGFDVTEHQKFCHECGRPLAPAAPDDELPRPTAIDADLPTQPVPTEAGASAPFPDATPTTIDADLPTQPVATQPVATRTAPTVDDSADDGSPDDAAVASDPADATVVIVPSTVPFTAAPVTAEMPALFDGDDDLTEYPPAREPFRLRVIFILSLFGAATALMTLIADVVDIRTTRPTSGITTGVRTLEDLGSNLSLAVFAGIAAMVLGGLLACFGLRWGAGLAGGGGLAVVGWAGLTIGLAELPIAVAESITRTSTEAFTLRVTRDVGWWLIVGLGAIALIVFVLSLRAAGTGGRSALNPLVAAVTAVAAVTLACGPLVPVGSADFADNVRSTDPTQDLPAAFFAGRLGQVGLVMLAGVVGMLIVRRWGLGLAAGGVTVAAVLWATSLAELGDRPIGLAFRNPGATSTVPHAVTTVGAVSTLVLLALAAVLAIVRLRRDRTT